MTAKPALRLKQVVVLGANGAMGAGSGALFAAGGCEVTLVARELAKAEQAREQVKSITKSERVADHVTDGPAGVAPPIISRLQPGALRPISRLAREDAEPLEDDSVGGEDGVPIQRACCESCAHGGPCGGKPHDERERDPGMPVQRESIVEKYESIIRLKQDCDTLDARGPGTPLPAPTLRLRQPRPA